MYMGFRASCGSCSTVNLKLNWCSALADVMDDLWVCVGDPHNSIAVTALGIENARKKAGTPGFRYGTRP
jgi:hypothetical protein